MKLKWILYKFLLRLFGLLKIKNNKILFCSYHGNSYSGNPRYIAEALKKKDENLDIVWLASKPLDLPTGMRCVKVKSISALYEYATSKIWIDDSRKPIWLIKRGDQFYIQTWHASIGLKKAEGLAVDTLPKEYVDSAKHDSEMADLFLSDSEWLTKNYREAYWYGGPVLEKGLPREDLLYSPHMPFRNHLIEENDYPKDTRFVLYAPTFRNSGDLSCYDIDFLRLIQTLENKTGNTWKIIIRLHPNIQDKQNSIKYDSDVLNGSKYSDINELILASDLFISDYSSCIFDAVIANVPSIIYASDIDDFTEHERGLFFSWDELPFAITRNNNELNSAIEEINVHDYLIKASNFMERCGFIKNEHASADVADYILNVISGSINCYGK